VFTPLQTPIGGQQRAVPSSAHGITRPQISWSDTGGSTMSTDYDYPTALTDEPWEWLQPLRPERTWRPGGAGRPPYAVRRLLQWQPQVVCSADGPPVAAGTRGGESPWPPRVHAGVEEEVGGMA
jgi:hypothetical protein